MVNLAKSNEFAEVLATPPKNPSKFYKKYKKVMGVTTSIDWLRPLPVSLLQGSSVPSIAAFHISLFSQCLCTTILIESVNAMHWSSSHIAQHND